MDRSIDELIEKLRAGGASVIVLKGEAASFPFETVTLEAGQIGYCAMWEDRMGNRYTLPYRDLIGTTGLDATSRAVFYADTAEACGLNFIGVSEIQWGAPAVQFETGWDSDPRTAEPEVRGFLVAGPRWHELVEERRDELIRDLIAHGYPPVIEPAKLITNSKQAIIPDFPGGKIPEHLS